MPVKASWFDDAHTIVHIEFSDPWTLADLSAGIQTGRQLMSSVDHTVDAIWDGTNTKGAPSNVFSHFMVANEDTEIPANQRFVIVVVRSAFLHTFASTAKRLLPRITRNMHITNSLQAAEQKIEALRKA